MKKIFAIFLVAGLGAVAYAQNLNPTVSITNTYKSGKEEGDKQYVAVTLPDSLTRFNYKFDYSVFDTPYKGAFEFSPYAVKFTPDGKVTDSNTLFVRAGAGYGLYPQLQAVWSPLKKNSFSLNVHQDFHGYYGKYRTVRKDPDSYPMMTTKGDRYVGYDFSEQFGVDGRYNGKKFDAGFGVDYNGIFTSDEYADNAFNSVVARAGVKSNGGSWRKLYYDATLTLDFASDALSHPFSGRTLHQGGFDIAATLGPKLSDKFGVLVDARLKSVGYRGADEFAYSYFGFAVAPHVSLTFGPVDLSAGIKVDGTSRVRLAPDVRASMKLFDNRIRLTASATGGTIFNSYSDLRRDCHWFCPGLSETVVNSFERVNLSLGLDGSVAGRLRYEVRGGWASAGDMPLWGVREVSGYFKPVLRFRDYDYAYADLSLVWKSEHIDADGAFHFRKSSLGGVTDVFDLPVAGGNLRVAYNWNHRISAGVKMNAASPRKAVVSNVPLQLKGYVDLGIFGEYRFNQRWSVWVEGSNLLNRAIQITPMHVENGINGTAGICLHL